jgi:hypothetical protein
MEALQMPFNQAQLDILKVLARPMSDAELVELKRVIVRFFANKLVAQANETWDKNGWTAADTEQLAQRHFRTSCNDAKP